MGLFGFCQILSSLTDFFVVTYDKKESEWQGEKVLANQNGRVLNYNTIVS